jgi:hypothetical protein
MWDKSAIAILGEFDLLKIGPARNIKINFEKEPWGEEVQVNFELEVSYGDYFIQLFMSDVSQVILPELGGQHFILAELTVEKIRDYGLERTNYKLTDHLGQFSCYCKNIEIQQISRIDEFDMENVVWKS